MLRPEVATQSLQNATNSFAHLLARAKEDSEVPTCPGWKVRDLAVHLGTVHRWAAAILLGGTMVPTPKPLVSEALQQWYQSTANALISAIAAVAPGEVVPNFARVNEYASFWPRRQLHETLVHLYDLARAMELPEESVDHRLASDGIDEVLTVIFPRLVAKGTPPVIQENIRIHAIDTGEEWVLLPGRISELGQPGTVCNASISGPAQELYLVLWGRHSADLLSCEGEAARALLDGPTSV